MEYRVTLEQPGLTTNFTTDDKDETMRAFNMKAVLTLDKPNGDQFAIRMEDFSYIGIDVIQEESE